MTQQRDDQHPDLQNPDNPQHRYRPQREGTPDAGPHENGFATPPIDVYASDEPEHCIRHELSGVHNTDLERCRAEYLNHQYGHRNRRDRRADRTDRRSRPKPTKRRAGGWSESIAHQLTPSRVCTRQ
jgi:hypothetical protein